jgi:DNA-binding GntR family transcriptional regulator
MKVSDKDEGWFESERTLGAIGDRIFLETRHRILTGIYRPGQLIDGGKLADAFGIEPELGGRIIQALADHGYLNDKRGDLARIIDWNDAEFADLLSICRDLLDMALIKACDRMDDAIIADLKRSMEIDLNLEITPEIFESFHIRWWIYLHIIIYAVEVRSFRKMMLTGAPPALRRRIFIVLDSAGLRSMQSDLKAVISALVERNQKKLKELIAHQWQRFVPVLAAENSRFNQIADNGEVDYFERSLPERPIFRTTTDPRPAFNIGYREPLSWDEFEQMDIV